ncbi:hypothetical protein K7X08_027613 [Anisodus acutangulus]|uniref:STAS domain-containing protein n=1 Tax=Anisodus acutangulus TaxID=402998 RepID=A0A9Q1MMR7_9SOLA|nr:hypothetical protein K7X08_027613 [Anisodus acutangulus]
MGSSRDIAIGPVAVVSLLLGPLLRNEIDPTTNPIELGFLIDFLSHDAVVGSMGGAAITIALQQLKVKLADNSHWINLFNFPYVRKVHRKSPELYRLNLEIEELDSVYSTLKNFDNQGKKNKKLFWVPAFAPLISVILSTFFVYITYAEKKGVAIVGFIEKGINPPSVNKIYFTGDYLLKGIRTRSGQWAGLGSGGPGLEGSGRDGRRGGEAVAIGRTFASMKVYQLDGNKEMLIDSPRAGSVSRSAVNYMAGFQTEVSNIVMSVVVFITLEFITPLFKYTLNAILAAIIISVVLGLIGYEAANMIWKIDKFDFVTISFAKILLQVTRPRTATLGRIPQTNVYRNIQQYLEATKVPSVLIVRVDSAIYFSNFNYIKERILRWLMDEEEHFKAAGLPRIQFLIVEMSLVTDIDTSVIHALEELLRCLKKKNVQLVLSNPGRIVIDKLHASNFPSQIGEDKIFLTVADAVLTCSLKLPEEV